jgi:hypothetical protein
MKNISILRSEDPVPENEEKPADPENKDKPADQDKPACAL